jgi:hypothetical protein
MRNDDARLQLGELQARSARALDRTAMSLSDLFTALVVLWTVQGLVIWAFLP